MTDHAKAIEAGARAIDPDAFDESEERGPAWSFNHKYARHMARLRARDCIQAAIASGALVPASAVAEMREETGWLIEKDDPPVYAILSADYDEHWTSDASKALRFARREDAQAYSDHVGWTSPPVRIVEHLWTDGAKPEVIAFSNGHRWIKAFNLTCCRDCGIVRRSDDQNKPCKGAVKVGPRQLDLAPASGDYVVVPKTLTDAMKETAAHIADGPFVSAQEHWDAMLNAASRTGGGSK